MWEMNIGLGVWKNERDVFLSNSEFSNNYEDINGTRVKASKEETVEIQTEKQTST